MGRIAGPDLDPAGQPWGAARRSRPVDAHAHRMARPGTRPIPPPRPGAWTPCRVPRWPAAQLASPARSTSSSPRRSSTAPAVTSSRSVLAGSSHATRTLHRPRRTRRPRWRSCGPACGFLAPAATSLERNTPRNHHTMRGAVKRYLERVAAHRHIDLDPLMEWVTPSSPSARSPASGCSKCSRPPPRSSWSRAPTTCGAAPSAATGTCTARPTCAPTGAARASASARNLAPTRQTTTTLGCPTNAAQARHRRTHRPDQAARRAAQTAALVQGHPAA